MIRRTQGLSVVESVMLFLVLSAVTTAGLWLARRYVEFDVGRLTIASIGCIFIVCATRIVQGLRRMGKAADAWRRDR